MKHFLVCDQSAPALGAVSKMYASSVSKKIPPRAHRGGVRRRVLTVHGISKNKKRPDQEFHGISHGKYRPDLRFTLSTFTVSLTVSTSMYKKKNRENGTSRFLGTVKKLGGRICKVPGE